MGEKNAIEVQEYRKDKTIGAQKYRKENTAET